MEKENNPIIEGIKNEIEKNAFYNEDNFKESKILIELKYKKMEKENTMLLFLIIGLLIGYYGFHIQYINIIAYILIIKFMINYTEIKSYYKGFIDGYKNAKGFKIENN